MDGCFLTFENMGGQIRAINLSLTLKKRRFFLEVALGYNFFVSLEFMTIKRFKVINSQFDNYHGQN